MNTHEKLKESLILYRKGYSITKIQHYLKISDTTISKYLKSKGEIIKNKEYYDSLFKEAMDKYNEGQLSLTYVSEMYGIDRHALSRYFKKNGIKIPTSQSSPNIDENIFDEIDTEEKAYWLGFIYADGYISSRSNETRNGYKFELTSSLKDKNHMLKFAKFISFKNKVIIDNYRCRILFGNKHIWNTLNNYGCTPRKSLTLKFPNKNIFKSKDLIRHFIRGYCDGDGCLSWRNKEHTIPHLSILGTEEFLNTIQINTNHDKILKVHKDNRCGENSVRSLTYTGKTAKKISKFLYDNSNIYLDRKYKKYLIFCDLPY